MGILCTTSNISFTYQNGNNEICDNAIDDDGDGDIDLNDSDCRCDVLELTSLIPNPSFEDMSCCPSNRSQLDCADTWIQASGPTTDYIHQCGWMGWDNFPPPQPFPDGEAIIGFRDGRMISNGFEPELNWKEYTGACLSAPLLANTTYRFEFYVGFHSSASSPPITITFFGTTDCSNLPFGVNNDMFGCPTNGPGWTKLDSRNVSSPNGQGWIKTAILVTPTDDIYAIVIGPPCALSNNLESTYYFLDNLVLADLKSFEFRITENNHPCNPNVLLQIPLEPNLEYQWYKDKIALVGESAHTLSKMYGEGSYLVRFFDQTECKVTEAYDFKIPQFSNIADIEICFGESYAFGGQVLEHSGRYVNRFRNKDNCDSSVVLNLTVLPEIQEYINARIFEGERYESIENYTFTDRGEHTAELITDMGCDSIILLSLSYYQIYFPNVFTPNRDGQNDYFTISGAVDLKEIKKITIYDRWGTEVYQGTDELASESPGWNGEKQGQIIKPGIYTYITNLLMDDNVERKFVGSVLLLN
ncbi:MAG: gliding motility-associated-like protein [Saprospiraceae bacterium]